MSELDPEQDECPDCGGFYVGTACPIKECKRHDAMAALSKGKVFVDGRESQTEKWLARLYLLSLGAPSDRAATEFSQIRNLVRALRDQNQAMRLVLHETFISLDVPREKIRKVLDDGEP